MEGLAGIRDEHKLFERARVAPRWAAAGVDAAKVTMGYAASGAGVEYEYRATPNRITLRFRGTHCRGARFHVLLPRNACPAEVRINATPIAFQATSVRHSAYVDCDSADLAPGSECNVEVRLS